MNDFMDFVASKTFHCCCFQSFFHTWFSSTLFGKAGLPWHQLKIRWTHNLQRLRDMNNNDETNVFAQSSFILKS